jgi:hypothetical protein
MRVENSCYKFVILIRNLAAQKLIYGPGANNAAFWLFRASLYYHKDKSPKCDAIMRDFTRRELIVGVEILMDAAAAEFDTNRQADLLAAAAFGKVGKTTRQPPALELQVLDVVVLIPTTPSRHHAFLACSTSNCFCLDEPRAKQKPFVKGKWILGL